MSVFQGFLDHWFLRPGLGFARPKRVRISKAPPTSGGFVEIALPPGVGLDRVYANVARLPRGLAHLSLDRAIAFTRTVRIPRTARKDAAAIVGLDTAEATPFAAGTVAWALSSWRREGKMLAAEQVIVRRNLLTSLEAAFAQSGAQVDVVSVDDWPGCPTLMQTGVGRRGPRRWLAATAAIVVLALAALIWSQHRERAQLRSEIAAIEAQNETLLLQAARLHTARADRDRSLEAIDDVLTYLGATGNRLGLLQDLTETFHDSVSVTDLRVAGTRVDLLAHATTDGFGLVGEIGTLETVTDAKLTAPITRLPGGSQERVQLEFTYGAADGGRQAR